MNATADVGSQSNFRYRFADNFYRFRSRTDSTVAQLNSTFGTAFNLARVSYQRIRDRRGPRTAPFPQVTIDLEGGEEIRFGTEQFSTANALDQDIIEIHNDLTWVRGRHQLTIGTHNELFPVPQPVHPRQLRGLRVHQPGPLRAGAGPVLQLQLLAHRRPAGRRPSSGSTSSGSTPATSGGSATTSR